MKIVKYNETGYIWSLKYFMKKICALTIHKFKYLYKNFKLQQVFRF